MKKILLTLLSLVAFSAIAKAENARLFLTPNSTYLITSPLLVVGFESDFNDSIKILKMDGSDPTPNDTFYKFYLQTLSRNETTVLKLNTSLNKDYNIIINSNPQNAKEKAPFQTVDPAFGYLQIQKIGI